MSISNVNSRLAEIVRHECKLTKASGQVARFSYTESAYNADNAEGVSCYNYSNAQNIPLANAGVLSVDSKLLDKGVRSQASSITRQMVNHFFGRTSYNVNKLADYLYTFLSDTYQTDLNQNGNFWSDSANYVADNIVMISTVQYNCPAIRFYRALQDNTCAEPTTHPDTWQLIDTFPHMIGGYINTRGAIDSNKVSCGVGIGGNQIKGFSGLSIDSNSYFALNACCEGGSILNCTCGQFRVCSGCIYVYNGGNLFLATCSKANIRIQDTLSIQGHCNAWLTYDGSYQALACCSASLQSVTSYTRVYSQCNKVIICTGATDGDEVLICSPVRTRITGRTEIDTLAISRCVDGRLSVCGDIRASQDIVAECNLVVHGNLLVDGTTTSTNETQVATTGDYLVTRENNDSPLTGSQFSGLAVNNFQRNKMATLTN